LSPTDIFLWGGILALISWLVVPRIGHRLAIDRERQRDAKIRSQTLDDSKAVRKRAFLESVVKWRTEIQTGYFANTFPVYSRGVPDFTKAAFDIQGDIPDSRRAEFDRLVSVASGFKAADNITRNPKQEDILAAFEALIRFTRDT